MPRSPFPYGGDSIPPLPPAPSVSSMLPSPKNSTAPPPGWPAPPSRRLTTCWPVRVGVPPSVSARHAAAASLGRCGRVIAILPVAQLVSLPPWRVPGGFWGEAPLGGSPPPSSPYLSHVSGGSRRARRNSLPLPPVSVPPLSAPPSSSFSVFPAVASNATSAASSTGFLHRAVSSLSVGGGSPPSS